MPSAFSRSPRRPIDFVPRPAGGLGFRPHAPGAGLRRIVLIAAFLAACIPGAPAARAGTAADPSSPNREPVRIPDPQERLRILRGLEGTVPSAKLGTARLTGARDALDDYDLRHVRLEIDISDTLSGTMQGAASNLVESRVDGLTAVVFDLGSSMNVDSVLVDGVAASFQHADQLVRVSLATPLGSGGSVLVRIAYHGSISSQSPGLHLQEHEGKAFIWNLSEPSDGRNWWPTKDRPDDKADSSDVLITAPAWMTATSNGLLRSVTEGAGTRTWWWHTSYPIATYLVSVTAGDFVRIEDHYQVPGGSPMLLEHFVFPDLETAARTDFNIAAEAIGAYAGLFGPYPFLREKYGVTLFGWAGGMEHQTNTSYGYQLVRGDHRYDWIYVHELSHQWWGDNVTCRTWDDSWLNEGFASWCEAAWAENRGGRQAYFAYMNGAHPVYDPSGPIFGYPDPFDGNTIYNKGSWVVHMLRGVLGDSLFFRGLADYRALYQGRSVSTEGFRAVMETTSGRDLGWFFQEWVYGRDRPQYRVSTLSEDNGAGQTVWVHLDQVQRIVGRFTMPVRIVARADTARREVTFMNDDRHDDLSFDLPAGSYDVQVDPETWILRTVQTGPYGLNLLTTDLAPTPRETVVDLPLAARGGTPPYDWELVDPAPPGIILDPTLGLLQGAPAVDGAYEFRVKVNDSAHPPDSDVQSITWTIQPAPADSSGAPPVAAWQGVRAAPNPFLRSVLLSFSAAGTGPSEWMVFDLKGRLVVRAEGRSTGAAGVRSWIWDGLDAAGNRVAPGLYFVRGREPAGSTKHDGSVLVLR